MEQTLNMLWVLETDTYLSGCVNLRFYIRKNYTSTPCCALLS